MPADLVKIQTERIRRLEIEQLVLVLHLTPQVQHSVTFRDTTSFTNNDVRKLHSLILEISEDLGVRVSGEPPGGYPVCPDQDAPEQRGHSSDSVNASRRTLTH